MPNQIDLIEERLQSFIEDRILQLPWGNPQVRLAHELVEAMQNHLAPQPDGGFIAPDVYIIFLHPENPAFQQYSQELFDSLSTVLYESAQEAGGHFNFHPSVRLASDPALPEDGLYITALTHHESIGETAAIDLTDGSPERPPRSTIPKNAFLIVQGSKTFSLDQPVVNIGRRLTNHLVIDDPRVSRSHVQLRAIRGQYVLFDLNSTGGTYVNGQRVNQFTLNPGDVISLAGVPVIYGEDAPAFDTGPSGTGPLPPAPGKNSPEEGL